MNFGNKLKQLRHAKKLGQPELAEAMGIEQSYLSKLENNKSLPSNDVLNRILDVFGLEIGDLLGDLDQGTQNQLRQIPDVADHFKRQKQQLIGNRRRWLLVSAVLVSFGVAFIYAGQVHLFFSDTVYQYMSHGVVHEGESKEFFRPRQTRSFSAQSPQHKAAIERFDAATARTDEDYLLHNEFRGHIYNVKVEGGSRTYYLENEKRIDPWQNKLVTFIGVLMTILGLVGIFLERKLSRSI